MRGITIIYNDTEIHTGNDLDLVQEKKEIGSPEIQTETRQVPGRNGLLNLTKALTSKVCYYNRSLSFRYFGTGSRPELLSLEAQFLAYHGQTVQIVDDDRPAYYYEGEASVTTEIHGNYILIYLEVDAQPFRMKKDLTTVSKSASSGGTTVTISNEYAPAVPEITTTAEITITFGSKSLTVSAGTYDVDDFELSAGENTFILKGSGTVTFKYREGAI